MELKSESESLNVMVTELLMRSLESATKKLIRSSLERASRRHGFDLNVELEAQDLEKVSITRVAMGKRKGKLVSVVEKRVKRFPLPFMKSHVSADCCQGLVYNGGLFTQCLKSRCSESDEYCKDCEFESSMSSRGYPNAGNVSLRSSCGLYEYKDSKGRSPISYLKFLSNKKLSVSDAEDEARRLNLEIPSCHLEVRVVKRGRKPKALSGKHAVVVCDDVGKRDMFVGLSSNVDESAADVDESAADEDESASNVDESASNVDESAAKVDESAAKADKAEKAAAKAEKAAAKAAKEAAKAEKAAAKEAKAEKVAAKEAAKAAKEAAKEAAKAEKAAAKEAAKAEKAAAKKTAKVSKASTKVEKVVADSAAEAEKVVADSAAEVEKVVADSAAKVEKVVADSAAEAEKVVADSAAEVEKVVADSAAKVEKVVAVPKVSVCRFTHDGITYLRSSENLLYDINTKEECGLWDEKTSTIKEIQDDSEDEVEDEDECEMSADEYDSDA